MQQDINLKQTAASGTYRFFDDDGHGWLEVPRAEVIASGAEISGYSYYDPVTDMAYLEEDCDLWSFVAASGMVPGKGWKRVYSSMARTLPAYDAADFIDTHVFVVRPTGNGGRA